MAEVDIKFQDISLAPSLDAMSFFVGTHNDGSGYSDYRFTPVQLVAYVLGQIRRVVIAATANISNSGATLSNSFLANPISKIVTNNQVYQIGVDFTQNTGTTSVTWTNLNTFNDGQQLIFEQ